MWSEPRIVHNRPQGAPMQMKGKWTTGDFRRHGEMVLDILADFVGRGCRGEGPVVRVRPVDELDRTMNLQEVMAGGCTDDRGLRTLIEAFLDGATNLHHPGYIAHQVSVPHYASALADLISGSISNGMSVYEMGPTAGTMEIAVIDWMLGKIGWQPTGRNSDHRPDARVQARWRRSDPRWVVGQSDGHARCPRSHPAGGMEERDLEGSGRGRPRVRPLLALAGGGDHGSRHIVAGFRTQR